MTTKTVTRFFPRSHATLVHQDGSQIGVPSKGIEVILHTRVNENDPCCAEVISGDYYADIGLSFENGKLVDYDGVFSLPREVGELLTDAGYIISNDCFA
jgi:hypothetical protein